jgi:DNA-directed RNA polymerase specialized sigma24 family protein
MPSSQTDQTGDSKEVRAHSLFVTTRWSMVLNAKNKAAPGSKEALESLCGTYWYPIYAFVRGTGRLPPEAQDLTQDFFVQLLSKDFLQVVTPEKGRFRTFLRMALTRFLANEWDRSRAQKRGGGVAHLSFDTALAEERLGREEGRGLAPDRLYDRSWALTLMEEVMARLEQEYRAEGKSELCQQLQPHLTAERGSIDYAEVARKLGVAEGAARVALHRFRKRFREVFRQSIAETVSTPEEVESEMRLVLEILSDG